MLQCTSFLLLAAADFLKRLNFQLRNEDPKYKEAYEKWEAIVNAAE